MKESELKYSKYIFKFKYPLHISNQILREKDVILLRYRTEREQTHYGEVSPLPGFSSEKIEECEELLYNSESISDIIKRHELRALHDAYSSYPSLLFGIEQIICSGELLDSKCSFQNKSIKNNALIGIKSERKTIEEVKKHIEAGFDTVKLKIGRPEFDDDLSILNRIDNLYGTKVNLRLDNNCSWNLNQAKRNIESLLKFNIEYLEQPVMSLDDLLCLNEFSELNIAPDESITSYSIGKQLIENGNFKFLVLKPSIRLGLYNSLELIKISSKMNVNIIISSAFETVVGRTSLLHLASLTEHKYAHGLNTELLGTELIVPTVDYESPEIFANPSKLFNYTFAQA